MQLLVSAFAISVAALTLVLAARRLLVMGSRLVMSRWFWAGGVIAFSAGPTIRLGDTTEYRVRFEVGGPGSCHNVSVHVRGLAESNGGGRLPPHRRTTMNAGDDPIDFTFTVLDSESASRAWVVVTWVRPYLEDVESEAVARWLHGKDLYEWLWYSEANRLARIGLRNWARRHQGRSTRKLRDLAIFGRWRVTTVSSEIEMQGPVEVPLPR
ncbi:hypothetical protein [Mycobacterium sp. URHB0021]